MKSGINLYPILLILILLTPIFSCEEENLEAQSNPDLELPKGDFFQPMVRVEKGDGNVTVSIIDPRPFTNYVTVPGDPEFFEIFYSTDPGNLVAAGTYHYPENDVLIEGLENNKELYFTVSTNAEGFRPFFSDTVMVVPSKIIQPEELYPAYDFPLSAFGSSVNQEYLAFESYDISNEDYSASHIYNVNTSNDALVLVDEEAYGISWANNTNTFAYVTTARDGSFLNSVRINTYNAETNTSNNLLDVQNEGLNVLDPVYSPGDELIAYMSNENSAEDYNFNVWTIDPVTEEKIQITDFEAVSFSCYGYLDWSEDGNSIYVSGFYYPSNGGNTIYRLDINSGTLSQVFQTRWTDRQSFVSPNNLELAFWSKRTGDWELWVYNLTDGSFAQITGGNPGYLFSPSKVTWLNDTEIALVAFSNGRNRVVKIGLQ